MVRRIVSPILVGRSAQLTVAERALDQVAAGAPNHLLIAGEAGVGKSRLAREIRERARLRGMRTLLGGCANVGEGGHPYGPVVEILRDLAGQMDPGELERLAGRWRAELTVLLPSLAPAGAAGAEAPQSESDGARLREALLALITAVAAESPTLLTVEDLHWSDPATREIVAFLVRNLDRSRAGLVLTLRADELHRRHPVLPWLAELDRSGRIERIDLPRLDPSETRSLAAAILGVDTSEGLVEEIVRRSEGNPFFVEELVGAGDRGAAGRLPPTLREVLLARIAGLPEPAQAVIRIAAVAGRAVDHELLEAIAPLDRPALLEALRAAVGSQVLETGVAGSDYTFRHALLQEAAYDDLLPGERVGLHRAFAEALDRHGAGTGAQAAGHWAELAHHWSEGREDVRAFGAYLMAGELAARTFAFEDAARHDERALELWRRVEGAEELAGIDEVDLLERTAQAAWLAGDLRRAVGLRRAALEALGPDADPIRKGVHLERLGRALWTTGETGASLDAHERAVTVMPSEPPTAERARVLSGYGQLLMLVDRVAESEAVCREAILMARQVGARQPEGHALTSLGVDLAQTYHCEEALTSLRRGIEIAREIANADDIGRGFVNLTTTNVYCGDLDGAAAALAEGLKVVEEIGLTRTYGQFLRQNGITIEFERGNWDVAARCAEECRIPELPGHLKRYGLSHWVELLVARGDSRGGEQLGALGALVEGLPVEAQFHMPHRLAVAARQLWDGDPATARETLGRAIGELGPSVGRHYRGRVYRMGAWTAADLAELARARRDPNGEARAIEWASQLAADLEAVLSPILVEHRTSATDALAADRQTVVAEVRRAHGASDPAEWSAVVSAWELARRPYQAAIGRWREGEAHLGRGDRASAVPILAAARETAVRLGAAPLLGEIDGLAARARLDLTADRPAASPQPGRAPTAPIPFGLTRRERDVLPLLIQGRTNRQIAEALFISENTAGVHVSNILGKLGASSRTEAAAIAARLGLDRE